MYILSEEELGGKKSLSRNWNVFVPRGVLGYLVKYVVLDVIELGQGMEINWSKLIIVLLETPTAVWNYRISCPLLFTVPLAGKYFLNFFQAYVSTFLFVIFSATYYIGTVFWCWVQIKFAELSEDFGSRKKRKNGE